MVGNPQALWVVQLSCIFSILLQFSRHFSLIDNVNTRPRLDALGQIMDAHDFSLRKFPRAGGGYWMNAVAYGGCVEPMKLGCDQTPDDCGFQTRMQ